MNAECVGELVAEKGAAPKTSLQRKPLRGHFLFPKPDLDGAARPAITLQAGEGPSFSDLAKIAAGGEDIPGNDTGPEDLTDSTARYLREIGRTPLLTAQQEVDLAERMETGRIAQAKLQTCEIDISPDDRQKLADKVAAGEAARRRMIKSNLRLVASIAKRYLGKGNGLGLLDLCQEGNIGLMRAVDKFDYTRGYKLSTYATWWIRQAVSRAVADQSRIIRLPIHISDALRKINGAFCILTQTLGREPTPEEIGAQLGWTEKKVAQILQSAHEPDSLDRGVGDGSDGVTLGDRVPDNTEPLDDLFDKTAKEEAIREALGGLNGRERRVIELRFGLKGCMGNEAPSLAEVGRLLGVSRELARLIEAEALGKLRRTPALKALRRLLLASD